MPPLSSSVPSIVFPISVVVDTRNVEEVGERFLSLCARCRSKVGVRLSPPARRLWLKRRLERVDRGIMRTALSAGEGTDVGA